MTIAPRPLGGRHLHRPGRLAGAVLLALAAGAVGVLIGRAAFGGSSGTSGSDGSGHAISQARRMPAFGAVELAGSIPVTVRAGAPRSVVVHADDNLVSRVTTRVEGGTLVVGTLPGSFRARVSTYVAVTTPTLTALTLSGSGIVTLEGVRGPSFALRLPGSGIVRASGSVGTLRVSLGGSGDAQLGGLTAREVHASVAGSGTIAVTATESLDATVSGSGAILYGGNPPHVLTNVTGSGVVTPLG